MNDRSNEALLARRAKAEAATPGPWKVTGEWTCQVVTDYTPQKQRAGGYGSGNDFVCYLNDGENCGYDNEEEQKSTAAHIAANDPGTVIEDINEILRLRSLVKEHEEYIANLELEARAYDKKIGEIAAILGITPDAGNMRIPGYIKDEILRLQAENARLDREADWLAGQMHKTLVIDGKHKSKCVFGKDEWREAARKATETPAQEVKQNAKQSPKWAWAKG